MFSSSLCAGEDAQSPEVHSVVVLGGGIGALTSAMYLGRAEMHPVVIEGKTPGGALTQSHSVQNWPGDLDISGTALMDKVRLHAQKSGALFLQQEVTKVDLSKRPFAITTRDIYDLQKVRELKAQTIIIAMGSSPNTLGVPGEAEYFSKGVYSCALCDGALYRNKIVALVGGGDAAVTEGLYLSKIAKKVILLVRSKEWRAKDEAMKKELLAQPNVVVMMETSVKKIEGNGKQATHLLLNRGKNTEKLPIDALFLAIGAKPNTALFRNQLTCNENGFIVCNQEQETSVDGVLAIGDITGGLCKQAVCAAGEGASATLHIQRYLKPRSVENFTFDKVSASGLQQAKPVSKQPMCKHMGDADSCKDGDAGAVQSEVFNRSRFKPQMLIEESHPVTEIASIEELQNELKKGNQPAVVDFYATWCSPCKLLSPRFDALAENLSKKIRFLKVNVDKAPDLTALYKIRSMPTLLVFNEKGEITQRKVGTDEIFRFAADLEKQQKLPN